MIFGRVRVVIVLRKNYIIWLKLNKYNKYIVICRYFGLRFFFFLVFYSIG